MLFFTLILEFSFMSVLISPVIISQETCLKQSAVTLALHQIIMFSASWQWDLILTITPEFLNPPSCSVRCNKAEDVIKCFTRRIYPVRTQTKDELQEEDEEQHELSWGCLHMKQTLHTFARLMLLVWCDTWCPTFNQTFISLQFILIEYPLTLVNLIN